MDDTSDTSQREGANTPEPPDFPRQQAPVVELPPGVPQSPAPPPVETGQDDPMPGADRAGD